MKCVKCKKEKDETSFQLKNKVFKNCFDCREKGILWRQKNKERISDYNKLNLKKKHINKKIRVILCKKVEDSEDKWLTFSTQLEASKQLNLYTANISKVINGKLSQTGGYIFKVDFIEPNESKHLKSWDEIKKEKNYKELVKGKPSIKRILHEKKNNIIGKACCKCKEWKPLTLYNFSKTHWDKLRNDCKDCLVKYRKDNLKKISKKYIEYEKKRKLTDPEFKLLKTLISRLGSAIKIKNAKKLDSTLKLTGCSIGCLKGYLEAKFEEGMTWENHGKWHIDHIKPCCSFNLMDEEEKRVCFNYKNLQPLWAKDSLSKCGKI